MQKKKSILIFTNQIMDKNKNPGRFGPIPVRSGRFGPISGESRFGPVGAGRFGPISGMSHFGPVGAGRFGPIS